MATPAEIMSMEKKIDNMKKHQHSFFDKMNIRYHEIELQYMKMNKTGPGIPILTYSSLRLEQYITTGTSMYTFPVLAGVNSPGSNAILPTEVRLQQNDNFHASHMGFYLAFTAASTDTAFRLNTYPNQVLTGSAAIALNYYNIYNGTLNINVNQVDVLTYYRLSKHVVINQTQQLAPTYETNLDQVNMEKDSLVKLETPIMLSGAYTNTITITLPAAVNLALANNNSRMVIIYDGLRAQNAAMRKGGL